MTVRAKLKAKKSCRGCRLASVLHAGHKNANLGLVATRRAEASWKRYDGVATNTRGPEICKAWNLSDIEAETVHSQPARGLY